MILITLVFLIISNAVNNTLDKGVLFSRILVQSLFIGVTIGFSILGINALAKGIGIYGGLLNLTNITLTLQIFVFIITGIILSLTAFYPRKVWLTKLSGFFYYITHKLSYNKDIISNKTGEQFRIMEYSLIILFTISGGIFLISTADLISVFLSIELQSYGLYIMSTLYRDSESATGSGLTYFLLGGLSSCFILLGSALLYVNSGTTSLDNIYIISGISEAYSNHESMYQFSYINLSLIILSVGFLFKVSAAPFHFWSPDVYDGIPTIVTTYVAIVAKISIFAFLLELVYYTNSTCFDLTWKNVLLLSSLLSLFIGSVLGLSQFRIKRLYAYSTISHVGFILLALSINSVESIQAFIFYLLQYSITNLNAFFILISMGFSLYLYVYDNTEDKDNLIDKTNSPIQLISQIKGYFHINTFISISFAVTIFSFAGIPPIIGFFAKQMILSAALDKGYVFMALIAILTSVIGAGYYLNLIKEVFFYKTDYKKNISLDNITMTGYILPNNYKNIGMNMETTFEEETYNNIVNAKKLQLNHVKFGLNNISINSALSSTISIITSLLILFIFMPEEWLNITSILTLIQFKA